MTFEPRIEEKVEAGSTIYTDEMGSYRGFGGKGYEHKTINHEKKIYVDGLIHTNTIEGFWSQLKRSILSTHIHVSKQHLEKYLGEFEFRYNMRGKHRAGKMFGKLIHSFPSPSA